MAMSSYSVAQAKDQLPRLLDLMLSGEEVTITRRNRPIARLMPIAAPPTEQPRIDLDRLRALRDSAWTGVEPTDTVRQMREDYRY